MQDDFGKALQPSADMKNLSFFILFLLTISQITACNNGKRTDNTQTTTGQEYMVSASYYRGGWFTPPGQPNYSHDLTIDFTSYSNNGFEVDAEVTNPNCTRTGRLSVNQANEMAALISQLQLLQNNTAPVPDAGQEYVEIELKSGKTSRYYLQLTGTPAGKLYAINPQSVRSFMQALDTTLVQTCR